MQPRSAKHLEDIRDASDFVLTTTRELTLTRYLENRLVRQAVERNFEIVGEALKRLQREDPQVTLEIADAPRIIAFRNILAHGYDEIDHEIVWNLIESDLPVLFNSVTSLLELEGE